MLARARSLRILTLAAGSYAGLVGAHVLDYRLLGGSVPQRLRLLAATGHSYIGRAMGLIAPALIVAVIAAFAFGYKRGTNAVARVEWRTLAAAFALIQTGGFLILEATERVVLGRAGPRVALLTILGVILQCVVALALAALMRVIGRAGAHVARIAAGRRPRTIAVVAPVARAGADLEPRVRTLAFDIARRGPPSLVA